MPRDLPHSLRQGNTPSAADTKKILSQPEMTVKEAEKQLIMRALRETNGNRTEAAAKIGMSRRTLHRKLHAYNLEGY